MIIQGLWIGDKLSQYEFNSIKSYLNNEFEYHLYTYDKVENVPNGVIIKNANEIIPSCEIFDYEGSIAPFSDLFRYKLLYIKGNVWSDLDIYCVNKFIIDKDLLFVGERTIKEGAFKSLKPQKPLNSFIYSRHANNEIFKKMYEYCLKFKINYLEKKSKIVIRNNTGLTGYHWQGGVKYFGKMLEKYDYLKYIEPYEFGFPVDWWNWKYLFNNIIDDLNVNIGRGWDGSYNFKSILEDSKIIILHNGWIKNKKIDKDSEPLKNSFIDKLFSKINII